MTHLRLPTCPARRTQLQYKRFSDVWRVCNRPVLTCRCATNSGAIQTYEKMHCTMTRAGYPVRLSAGCLRAAGA
ncbi:MAG: hypothetical protein ACLT4C_08390 [Butyricicoccus sp.]